jgi:DnaJ-class molecular chaperone
MADYYNTLGVSKQATSDEIKKAYRKLASQHHPDKGGDTKKFQEIEEAYRTLSDPEKRSQYDNPQPQFNNGGFGGGGVPPGFEDIFSQMFGGNPFFGQGFRQPQAQRNRTLNIQTTISLEEAFHGKDLIANLTLPSGRDQILEVKIPAGIADGTTLRLAGVGDDMLPNMPRGDINLTVSVSPHDVYQRHGDDLYRTIDISCIDAMVGKKVLITTIDNKTLDLTIRPGTQPGQTLAAAGWGMPNMRDNRFKGRLLIEVNVIIPTTLTDVQKQILQEYFN